MGVDAVGDAKITPRQLLARTVSGWTFQPFGQKESYRKFSMKYLNALLIGSSFLIGTSCAVHISFSKFSFPVIKRTVNEKS
jgi:hypothetical protein